MALKKMAEIVNCQTGETEIVEISASEAAWIDKKYNETLTEYNAQKLIEDARAKAKASAESKLSALGLTPDEIAALRG